ncbi:MAG: response regulator [Lachnospiraceae bacterium]|nr:response regulator [Lachnospiraceae bacterium]
MHCNYDFCIASALVLLLLVIYNCCIVRKWKFIRKVYLVLLILSFGCCVADIFWGIVLMKNFRDNIFLNYAGGILYFSLQCAIPCCYFVYITVVSKKMDFVSKKVFIWLVPGIIMQALVYTTFLTGYIFTYNKDGYSRGPFMWVIVMVSAFYLGLGLCSVFSEGGNIGRRYKVVSIVFALIPACAVFIQAVYTGIVLSSSSMALSCLLMQFILQTPQMICEVNEKEIEARRAAEEANRAKSTFLANMSHEIRTPMNAICGMADMLERSSIPPHEMEYVQTIQVAARNLLGIINNILDFSKIDAGKLDLCNVNYRLDEMLRGVENIIASRVYGKNIDFEIDIKPGIPIYLDGDKTKIHQVLINILGNAAKFTERGKIKLYTGWEQLSGGKVKLIFEVTDTGIGIKEEDLPKLFNQFSQVDTIRNCNIKGTGLGLALSRGIAEHMGGDITVTSEYGKGSTFIVTIIQGIVKQPDSVPQTLDSYIVLVYEEDYNDRQHLSHILDEMGVKNEFIESADRINSSMFDHYSQEKKIFLYNYEQMQISDIKLPADVNVVALLEYFAVIKKGDLVYNYIKKPFDIFKVYDALFNNKPLYYKKWGKNNIVVNNAHVAVVDDNRVNLKVAVTQLKEWNIFAETFTSGQGLLKALEKGREYDIIFMDHIMPGMDGIETTINIRSMEGEYFKKVPVIALTANAVDGVMDEYKKAGMDSCLFKPFSLGQIEEKLAEFLPEEKVKFKNSSSGVLGNEQ